MKKLVPATMAAMLALSLAACSDSEEGGTDSGAPGYDVSGLEKNDEIAAMVPEAVAADGKLTVGVEVTYAPAEFFYTDGTTPIGYDVDMMKALAKVMGLELDLAQSEFAAILPGIPAKYELGISSFSITAERQENFNMIQYFEAGSSWSVAEGNPTGFDPADICGANVGVQTGTIQDDYIKAEAENCDISVQRFDQQSAVTTALTGGKIDAMMTDSSVGAYAVEQSGGKLEQAGEATDLAPVGVVVAKDDEAMTEATQAALQYLMDEGVLADIFAEWGITHDVATGAVLNPVK